MKFRRGSAFTIIEVMIAIAIFAMVITSIYAIWLAVLKGSRASLKAAGQVQSSRVALRSLRDAFANAQFFVENPLHYSFLTDNSGDMSAVSMVSRLPGSFPGVAIYPDLAMRRITFSVDADKELVMTQAPVLLDTNNNRGTPYSIVLARDVTLFTIDYWDQQKKEYTAEWRYTNQLPQKVVITLGTGKAAASSSDPQDVAVQEVMIIGAAVAGLQGGPPMRRPDAGLDPGLVPPPGTGIPPGQGTGTRNPFNQGNPFQKR